MSCQHSTARLNQIYFYLSLTIKYYSCAAKSICIKPFLMVYFTECVHTETTRGASIQDSQETEKR